MLLSDATSCRDGLPRLCRVYDERLFMFIARLPCFMPFCQRAFAAYMLRRADALLPLCCFLTLRFFMPRIITAAPPRRRHATLRAAF